MKKLLKSGSVNLNCCSAKNPAEFCKTGLAFLKDVGFEAADVCVDVFPDDQWQGLVEQAVQEADAVGIPFKICHLPFYMDPELACAEECIQRLRTAVDKAKILGAEYAVVHPNTVSMPVRSFNRTVAYDFVMRHLSPVADYAAKVGVNLAVENMRLVPGIRQSHRYCQDADELCEVADALGVSVCWDFGHANLAGFKQSEALQYIGKRLKVLHVNDNRAADDDHLPPFVGNVDWVDAMHGLALAEFDGCFNYEVEAGGIPAELRKDFAKYLVNAADKLMEHIV
ncbi:MAG: sugar phosphate isomerase/epimerase [Oscillospiraceae bacterium]|nr:sugar phosphate isomerase/epimerase [Oscillospiraceae bacterium]